MSVITPYCIISYPKLFKPEPRDKKREKEPVYSCVLIFDEATANTQAFAEIKETMKKVALEKHDAATVKGKKFNWALKKCSEYEGKMIFPAGSAYYMTPWNAQQPGIVDEDLQPVRLERDIYPGMMVRAEVNFFAYEDYGQGAGVSVGLNNVQIVDRTTPRLDTRRDATEVFGKVERKKGAPAAAAAGDDDAPAGNDLSDIDI